MKHSMDRPGVVTRPLCLILLAGLLAGGCGKGGRGGVSPPNIVLITLCSFRVDRLEAGGAERSLTPFLDRLATEGVFFENAVSASSWTKPSTASLLTGLTPNVHGLTDYYSVAALSRGEIPEPRVLAEEIETLPEILAGAGYATACRVNNIHAGEFFRLLQGCEDAVTRQDMTTADMVGDLERWLATVPREQPAFFHLFTRDVHTPYIPDYEDYLRLDRTGAPWPRERFLEEYGVLDGEVRRRVRARGKVLGDPPVGKELADTKLADTEPPATVPGDLQRRWIDLYEAQLPALDRALGRIPEILARAGRERETVIVVVGDHGERLFEGGQIGHGGFLDQPTLAIPLIFRGIGIRAGLRVPEVVRSIDLLPTLAALAGVATPEEVEGASLVPALRGRGVPEALTAFSSFGGTAHAVRRGPCRLYVGPGKERRLTCLEQGTEGTENLYAGQRERARALERELVHWLARERALIRDVAPPGHRRLTAEGVRELRALGYL